VISFRSPSWLHHPTGQFDLSYGTYVIAFPVEQCLVDFGLRQPVLLLLASIVTVLALAAVSWRCIERPALRIKPRRRTSGAGNAQWTVVAT
jgi:peptidoglycan/LPS O-acetylase OafA/YrhL